MGQGQVPIAGQAPVQIDRAQRPSGPQQRRICQRRSARPRERTGRGRLRIGQGRAPRLRAHRGARDSVQQVHPGIDNQARVQAPDNRLPVQARGNPVRARVLDNRRQVAGVAVHLLQWVPAALPEEALLAAAEEEAVRRRGQRVRADQPVAEAVEAEVVEDVVEYQMNQKQRIFL